MIEIPDFSGLRIAVFGDVMLDRYWFGSVDRISPEAPVPIVRVTDQDARAGGAANVAMNLASLGATVELTGVVGEDQEGVELKKLLQNAGVDLRLLSAPGAATTRKLRVVSKNQQLLRVDFETNPEPATRLAATTALLSTISGVQAVVVSDYGKGMVEDLDELVTTCVRSEVSVVIDPKGADFSRYRGATLVTPNRRELAAVIGEWSSEQVLCRQVFNLLGDTGISGLLLTLSEDGMMWFTADGRKFQGAARAREVFDVSGAGDTVVSIMALGLSLGLSEDQILSLANLAAGVVVAKFGTAVVTRGDLLAAATREMQS